MHVRKIQIRKTLGSKTKPCLEVEINNSLGKISPQEIGAHVPEHLDEIEKLLTDKFRGRDLTQEEFDRELSEVDGTSDFSRLGCAAAASSLAFKKAAGFQHSKKFPLPLSTLVGKSDTTCIQEFLVLPVNAETFTEAVKTNTKIFQELKQEDNIQGLNEDGELKSLVNDEETLELLKKVAEKYDARLGVDINADKLYQNGKYRVETLNQVNSPSQHIEFVQNLIDEYSLVYVEDAFHSDDFKYYARLTARNPDTLICGGDLFKTSSEKLEKGNVNNACNAITIKTGETGTITETKKAVQKAKKKSYTTIITEKQEAFDSTIADLSLEWETPLIKTKINNTGTTKLNKLLRLWDKTENPEINQM